MATFANQLEEFQKLLIGYKNVFEDGGFFAAGKLLDLNRTHIVDEQQKREALLRFWGGIQRRVDELMPNNAIVRAISRTQFDYVKLRLVKQAINEIHVAIGKLSGDNADTIGTGATGITNRAVFIGHGHSTEWLKLAQFLKERLGLRVIEFESIPSAGKTITDRLKEMLDQSSFAFLVMTAEEPHSDGRTHARENVIHEIGLFQGRLGFERAIVLLESGCNEFSNMTGLIQIRFPHDDIDAVFEKIRHQLEQASLLKPR